MNPIDPVPGREVSPGELLKERAHATLTIFRCPPVGLAQRALLRVILEQGTATADDVRLLVPVPAGTDPKFFGAAPGPLARAGIIRADGYRKSTRKAAHARPNIVWKLIDRAAALQWLILHPAPSEEFPAAGTETAHDGRSADAALLQD